MVAEVKGIYCPQRKWTVLAAGKANVTAMVRGSGDGKIVLSNSEPNGEPGEDYLTLNQTRSVGLSFVDNTTNVYVWPVSVELVVEVVRE